MGSFHSKQTLSDVHSIVSYSYADASARTAATGFDSDDLYKIAYQQDNGSFWLLTSVAPSWLQINTGSGSGTTFDDKATYIVLNATSSLSNERVLSVSGSSGLLSTDSGAGSSLLLSINNNIVATVSGTTFTGVVSASAGLSGSLQQVGPNMSYLLSQGGITITTQSNGQIVISGSVNTDTLPSAGTGITVVGSTVSINNNVVATVSGTTFTGVVSASAGLSGSLQRVGPNLPYLLSQGGITITTQSNGQIVISGSSGGSNPSAGTGILVNGSTVSINDNIVATVSGTRFTGPVSASAGLSGSLQMIGQNLTYLVALGGVSITTQSNGQIVISGSVNTDTLPLAGTGITASGATVSINNNVVATVSGTTFIGPVSASAGLSGSLQRIGPNLPYLLSQGGITLTTQSNGQIIISGSSGGGGENPVAGTGILVNGSTISIDDNVVATITGSTFTGPVSASAGLSGSLQNVGPNISYLATSGSVSTTTQSNGQVLISSPFATSFFRNSEDISNVFNNSTTTLRSALPLTASNLQPGLYRLSWNYMWRSNTTTNAFKGEIFVGTTSSYQQHQISNNSTAIVRQPVAGVLYVPITGSVQTFDLRVALSTAATNTTASVYARNIELWRVQ